MASDENTTEKGYETLSHLLPYGLRKTEKLPVNKPYIPAEIRNEGLLNTDLGHYHYIKLLGSGCIL
jgi:hypothetical protein